ncbi:MAG TPA: histidinol dehydrogenase [bacterium]|nr:histidinol dehydrogenase [bacterium]
MLYLYEKQNVDSFFSRLDAGIDPDSSTIEKNVSDILKNVQTCGDEALCRYAEKFDGVIMNREMLKSTAEQMKAAEEAFREIEPVLKQAAGRIRRYHERHLPGSWIERENGGSRLGVRIRPLDRVGCYVPGGRAPYPSSLFMTVIPAQVAGVKDIIVVSPPNAGGVVSPAVLNAARILGIERVYCAGGAQAVGALAFGTESIPRVDKVVGPGNAYVTEAKRQVYGRVDIDMLAGPSEVVILADETADPDFVAADLLAQAEHDPRSGSVLVTWSRDLASAVQESVNSQAACLSRLDIIRVSLKERGGILLSRNPQQAEDWVNRLAPEHLGLHVKDPWERLERIDHAGAVFLGSWSPETVGDYWAGPSHVLPTQGTARFASPLGTEDFMKRSSLIFFSRKDLEKDADAIIQLAKMEGLDAHANAVRCRVCKENGGSNPAGSPEITGLSGAATGG